MCVCVCCRDCSIVIANVGKPTLNSDDGSAKQCHAGTGNAKGSKSSSSKCYSKRFRTTPLPPKSLNPAVVVVPQPLKSVLFVQSPHRSHPASDHAMCTIMGKTCTDNPVEGRIKEVVGGHILTFDLCAKDVCA